MFLRRRVSKYPPNVIFRNANINAKRANVTSSMNWHNNVEANIQCKRDSVRYSEVSAAGRGRYERFHCICIYYKLSFT